MECVESALLEFHLQYRRWKDANLGDKEKRAVADAQMARIETVRRDLWSLVAQAEGAAALAGVSLNCERCRVEISAADFIAGNCPSCEAEAERAS
jgi:hypothetical protein